MNKTKIEWCDKTLNPVRCIDPLSGGLYPPLCVRPGGINGDGTRFGRTHPRGSEVGGGCSAEGSPRLCAVLFPLDRRRGCGPTRSGGRMGPGPGRVGVSACSCGLFPSPCDPL